MRYSALVPLLLTSALVAAPSPAKRPKLVVVISVDQFSAELMQTYGPELTGGLARLRKEGVFFTEAYHDHGFTETGPGHSVLLSGRFPANTGIVENRWIDRAAGRLVYCVEDPSATALHAPGQASSSSVRFLGEALGDWLQAQVPGSRVFSVSGKDRAAILMAGRKPTAAFWFTGAPGFTSSTAYGARLPEWLVQYDQDLSARLATNSWLWVKDPTTPEGRTAQWTFNGTTVRNGALPRLIQGAGMPQDKGFETRFRRSPFLDTVTLEAAEALLEGERLGHGPSTDLLAISFSATDYIGHNYGNMGTEMRDQMHRLDRTLGRLLDRLHQQHPDAWVVLCADHGGIDAPEALADQGFPARRLAIEPFMSAFQADLRTTFKIDHDLLLNTPEPNDLYLDEAVVKAANLDRGEVIRQALAWLKARPEVADAFTAEELKATDPAATGSPRDTSLRVLLRRSFHPERSGDILVAVKPYVVIGTPPADYLSNHGTPNGYDRRVPLIFWGPWKGGERREPVRTVDLAPTLARELGLKPGPVDGKALDLGQRK
ncbi:alkaline phosphatase family protein [Geothrix sp. PMB-07]|uniref:alkaline phosphatase family protein n=1 Tax=Geothrix sp. PMB-07 TaxID=3068640 RepID=UPI0027407205|nr:alkaline phosphatase family protein [Geothrix sp. PMB-07]WLT31587.1 alkaline phosphatase family protein [Geothrix sp. PMB-07]